MAHHITEKDKMFYVGQKPWHGIGKECKEVLTASEAILASGLDWEVIESPIFDNEGREIKGYKAITRKDTGECFQVSSKGYKIVQNKKGFEDFDSIVESGMAKYEVAGSLKGGRVTWMLASIPSLNFGLFNGKDEIKAYMTLFNSHDGSLAYTMIETPIRTVCWNTMQASLGNYTRKVSARHTVNVHGIFKNRADVVFAKAKENFLLYRESLEALAKKQFNQLAIDSFLENLFDLNSGEKVSTRQANIIDTIKTNHEMASGHQYGRGTAYGLYNAVTFYVDHQRGTDDNRLAGSWTGSGQALREKAFGLLINS